MLINTTTILINQKTPNAIPATAFFHLLIEAFHLTPPSTTINLLAGSGSHRIVFYPIQSSSPFSIQLRFRFSSNCLISQWSGENPNSHAAGREVRGATLGKLIGSSSFNQKGINQSCKKRTFTVTSLFGWKAPAKTKRETVVPDPDYRIPIVLLGATGGLIYTDNLIAAVPVGLLGLLLLVQATRVRFVFDDEALEVKVGSELKESGENAFVGGKNRWKYSSFVNWEFWWPNFPILVYFKETQTKPEGQIHFFPIIFNGKQLYDIMVERAGSSVTSGPK